MSTPLLPAQLVLDLVPDGTAGMRPAERSVAEPGMFLRLLVDEEAAVQLPADPAAAAKALENWIPEAWPPLRDVADSGEPLALPPGLDAVVLPLLPVPTSKLLPPAFILSAGAEAVPAVATSLEPARDPAAGGNETRPLVRLLDILQALYGPRPEVAGLPAGSGQATASAATLLRTVGQGEQAVSALATAAMHAETAAPRTMAEGSQLGLTVASSAPAAGAPPSFPLPAAAGGPDWSEALGQRVLWLARAGVAAAELRLTPPDLGAVEVRLKLEDDGLRLSFSAATVGARDALEQAAPRLRDMLAADGLALAGMDIDQRGDRDRSDAPRAGLAETAGPEPAEDAEEGLLHAPAVVRHGLVDTFV